MFLTLDSLTKFSSNIEAQKIILLQNNLHKLKKNTVSPFIFLIALFISYVK